MFRLWERVPGYQAASDENSEGDSEDNCRGAAIHFATADYCTE